MYKMAGLALVLFFIGCQEQKAKNKKESDAFDSRAFAGRFYKVALPYQLTDTALVTTQDTALIRDAFFLSFMADSAKGSSHVRYIPLAQANEAKGHSYFIVKAVAGATKKALVVVCDKAGNFQAVFPFLVPDDDPRTAQVSVLDKSFSITRSITQKMSNGETAEGKEVYLYNEAAKNFTLIMTDPLNKSTELINPIDTFSRTHPLAGDYIKDKKNIVSIRDARNPKEINFFIHFENGDGCTGELKGTALLTSSKTAVFRQSGDPCNIEFKFGAGSVSIKEVEGCGSHRQVQCIFEGVFSKKKVQKHFKKTK